MKNQNLMIILLFYSVSFLLVYISAMAYSKLKKRLGKNAGYITGVILGLSLVVLSIGTTYFSEGWKPDGRFILIYLGFIYITLIVLTAGLSMIFIIQEIQEQNLKIVEDVVATGHDGYCHYTIRNDKLTISERFYKMLGYDETDLVSFRQKLFKIEVENDQLIYEEDYPIVKQYVGALLRGKDIPNDVKIRMLCKDGSVKWTSFKIQLDYDDGDVTDILLIMKDINEICEMETEIDRLAYHDEDTNLKNQLAYSRTDFSVNSTVAFVKFNQYTIYSNFFGKTFKSDIKKYIGNELRDIFTYALDIYYIERGIFAVRFGEDYDYDHVRKLIEEKITKREFVYTFHGTEIVVKFLSTIFACPDRVSESEELYVRANAVFELHKELHSNRLIPFDEEMFERSKHMVKVSNLLNGALKYNELTVVFQPQYEEAETVPIAFEALLRWFNHDLGQVRPDFFIPIAESMGQIGVIDQFVLRKSCQFIKRYNAKFNLTASVSVNISFLELIDPNFASDIINVVESEQVEPTWLRIEVTETSIANVVGTVKDNLSCLKERGFDVHLDDFGTGYSSLNHLIKMNVDAIKLDKEFVWEMLEDDTTLLLIEGIIDLAHNLNMTVIAEGVEELEQYEKLKQLKCDKFQGYYFSKPMPEAVLMDTIKKCSEA